MRELDRREFDVHVACTTAKGREADLVRTRLSEIPGLSIVSCDFGPTVSQRGAWSIARQVPRTARLAGSLSRLAFYVRRNNIRIIHCSEKPRDALYGALLARLTGARSVVHMHVMLHDGLNSRARWGMDHGTAFIGVSEWVSETLRRAYPESRIHTAVNSIDVNRWDPRTSGAEFRARIGVNADDTLFVIASRIFRWKGHAELLEAFARVAAVNPTVRLAIVGTDDPRAHPGGGSFTAELRRRARELGIDDRVRFTGFQSNMVEVMAAADIFAMPSFEEPLGLVYLEAGAMRKPVVALRSGGVPEVVVHGETGLLSEPGDIDALTRNLCMLAEDRALRARMGRAAQEHVIRNFRPERLARDVERIYEHVLA
jgi:glycosyltransferase involved in cell wall biosynthesis